MVVADLLQPSTLFGRERMSLDTAKGLFSIQCFCLDSQQVMTPTHLCGGSHGSSVDLLAIVVL